MAQSTIGTAPVDPAVVAQAIPFATTAPRGEASTPVIGNSKTVPDAMHQRPRLTATGPNPPDSLVLDANGLATVSFTQAFDLPPGVTITSQNVKASGKPVPRFDFSYVMGAAGTPDAGKYVGAIVYGERQRPLPTLTPLSGTLSLLSGVISGTNAAIALLSGFLPTEPAAGAGFSLIAVKSSRVVT